MAFGIPNGRDIPVPGDFDGDGKTDIAVFDPPSATFFESFSGGGAKVFQFGVPNGRGLPVAGDFDGDGKTDTAVYDPLGSVFYIAYSGGGAKRYPFGIPNGQGRPIVGDFDGDGTADVAVFDPESAVHYESLSGGTARVFAFGVPAADDRPVSGPQPVPNLPTPVVRFAEVSAPPADAQIAPPRTIAKPRAALHRRIHRRSSPAIAVPSGHPTS